MSDITSGELPSDADLQPESTDETPESKKEKEEKS